MEEDELEGVEQSHDYNVVCLVVRMANAGLTLSQIRKLFYNHSLETLLEAEDSGISALEELDSLS